MLVWVHLTKSLQTNLLIKYYYSEYSCENSQPFYTLPILVSIVFWWRNIFPNRDEHVNTG